MGEQPFEYEVIRKLADGAVAEVFLARDPVTHEQRVLKVLRPELTSDPLLTGRFLDEAALCQRLIHPHVVRHYGVGKLPDGRIYLLTEYLEGVDLGAHLRAQGPLTGEQWVKLAEPLCDALEYVHQQGVVHRDLKPDNVFLAGGLARSDPRLLDFGLARFKGNKSVQTADGVLLATPEYTPPECIEGRPADARSDLYALGVLMFEALTGAPPFTAANYGELLLRHLHEEPPRLRGEVAYLDLVVRRCLAKKPEERYRSAKELRDALTSCQTGDAVEPTMVKTRKQVTSHHPAEREGDVLGNYELLRLLGEGSMGRVYQARHRRLGRQVALKVLKPEHANNRDLLQRFFEEARTVNQINHEHIIEIHDFVEERQADVNLAYCVMELLAGQSLAELIRAGPLPVIRAVRIVRQVCEALAAAHKVGVVHRDIKPDNIFITERSGVIDYVKVLDFGVAKLLAPVGAAASKRTMQGTIIGTPAYMAPEQASGIGTGPSSDLYSLGTVLYELLTGQPPFDGEAFGQLVVQITTQAPAPVAPVSASGEQVPPGLRALVMQCLEKKAERRPESMAALSESLRPFELPMRGAPPLAEGAPLLLVEPARPPKARGRLRAVGVGLGVALVGTMLWVWGAREPANRPFVPPPSAPVAVATPAPIAQPPPPPPPISPPMVSLVVRSNPSGARVTRSDTHEVLGKTPLNLQLPKGRPLTLRFELSGYKALEQDAAMDQNEEVLAQLRRPPTPKRAKTGVGRDGVIDPFAN